MGAAVGSGVSTGVGEAASPQATGIRRSKATKSPNRCRRLTRPRYFNIALPYMDFLGCRCLLSHTALLIAECSDGHRGNGHRQQRLGESSVGGGGCQHGIWLGGRALTSAVGQPAGDLRALNQGHREEQGARPGGLEIGRSVALPGCPVADHTHQMPRWEASSRGHQGRCVESPLPRSPQPCLSLARAH